MRKLLTMIGLNIPDQEDPYEVWVSVNQRNDRYEEYLCGRLDKAGGVLPRISIIMPVYNPDLVYLEEAIGSVRNQLYPDWELCVADDGSTNPKVHEFLSDIEKSDGRVKVCFRESNGNISKATNSAAELASYDILLFLDQDDLLAYDALAHVALYFGLHEQADIVYSDDDKIDGKGRRYAPQFKPDWSPELLLSYMYFGHLFAVRRSLYVQLGGMRIGYEGSQDYDFSLRAVEKARHVGHIPQILYHWRAIPGSTAMSGNAKPDSFIAGEKAVQSALDRRNIKATAARPEWAKRCNVGVFNNEFPDDGPSVTVIIPTRNQHRMLDKCLESLKQTTYRNYKIVIIDNNSDDPEALDYLGDQLNEVIKIPNPGDSFSYSYINNQAARQADSDYLLFLNNDTEVINPQWLSAMVGLGQIDGVGAVGARLHYPNNRIQHAGVIHGYYHGLAGPAFKNSDIRDAGYLSYMNVTRNYSAVTAACMLTPRGLFLEVGGFDEHDFALAYNDVDYCYRLVEKGYRNVYCPEAVLVHHEGATRKHYDHPREIATFKQKYRMFCDHYYSPHLSLACERFSVQPRKVIDDRIDPIKTLMCAHNLNWEGAPISQFELTLQLKKSGTIDPVVFSPLDGPLRAAYEDAGITVCVHDWPLRRVFSVAQYAEAISEVCSFVKDHNVRLVYGNTLETFYAISAARELGVPAIWNVRESERWQLYYSHYGPHIEKLALKNFCYPYRVIFVADATRNRYRLLNSHHNFITIHNGLNIENVKKQQDQWPRSKSRYDLGLKNEDIMVLLPGTVCERKGQHDLVRAINKLPVECWQTAQFYIVGDRTSSYSRKLFNLAKKLPRELIDRVHIKRETDAIAQYYTAADIFVCTSRMESYPRVILEAMAYGLPIITTSVFGIHEQVMPGINALYYRPGNPVELAEALAKLFLDSKKRNEMAQNSREVLSTLTSFDEMTAAYGEIFREAAYSTPGE